MILVSLRDGDSIKLDPRKRGDLTALDSPEFLKRVSRVAILSDKGFRTDLPSNDNGMTRIWLELVIYDNDLKGERVCMMIRGRIFKATLFYSDERVVLEFR